MARLRATLARSDADRELHRQIADATRYVAKAQDVCLRVARSRDPALRVEAQRARVTQQTLQQVRGLLDRVSFFAPGYDRGDPDLMPEAERQAESEKQRQAARRQQQSERKKQAEKQAEKKRVSPEQHIREALEKMREQNGPE